MGKIVIITHMHTIYLLCGLNNVPYIKHLGQFLAQSKLSICFRYYCYHYDYYTLHITPGNMDVYNKSKTDKFSALKKVIVP